jgi:ketosteroid isomerase-like protein
LVEQIYARFYAGDINGAAALFAPDIEWVEPKANSCPKRGEPTRA